MSSSSSDGLQLQVNEVYFEDEAGACATFLFCSNETRDSVCIKVAGFRPRLIVRIPDDVYVPKLVKTLETKLRLSSVVSDVRYGFDMLGFTLDRKTKKRKKHRLLFLDFTSIKERNKVKRLFGTTEHGERSKPNPADFLTLTTVLERMYTEFGDTDLAAIDSLLKDTRAFTVYNERESDTSVFFKQIKTTPSGWIRIDGTILSSDARRCFSRCDNEGSVQLKQITGLPDRSDIVEHRVLSFDLEVQGDTNRFPRSFRANDEVIVIGLAVNDSRIRNRCLYQSGARHHIEALSVLTDDDAYDLIECKDECDLLNRFNDEVLAIDPDVFTGHNIFNFDFVYLYDRCRLFTFFASHADLSLDSFKEMQEAAADVMQQYEVLRKQYIDAKSDAAIEHLCTQARRLLTPLAKGRTSFFPMPPDTLRLLASFDTAADVEQTYARFSAMAARGATCYFGDLSRLPATGRTLLKTKRLSSAAMGANTIYFPNIVGRMSVDTYMHFKTSQYRLNNYRLSTLSKFLLNDDKIDMPINVMNRAWKDADDVLMRKVCDYCMKDVLLPLDLLTVDSVLIGLAESARVTRTPMSVLVVSGQRVKVLNQLYSYGESSQRYVNSYHIPKPAKYEGATVLEPVHGWHEDWITVADFASLYPSIIIQYNICCSTLIIDYSPAVYDNASVSFVKYELPKQKTVHRFVTSIRGIIPEMEEFLLKYRKRVKRQMKAHASSSRQYKILNAKQMAIKVSCNSIYGFFGVRTGALKCMPVAETVTFVGRQVRAYVRVRTTVRVDIKRPSVGQQFSRCISKKTERSQNEYNKSKRPKQSLS